MTTITWEHQRAGRCVVCGRPVSRPHAVRLTCSRPCHEQLVAELETRFGIIKRVTGPDGITHLVPLREIIEHGLRGDDLARWPTEEPRRPA